MRGQAVAIEAPDADAEMAHHQAILVVRLDTIGPRVAARDLDRDTRLRWRPACHERQAPDLLRARDGNVHMEVLLIQRDAIRRRRVVQELRQLAVLAQPPDPPGRVGDAALPLIGEVEIAVVGEVQIVEALEALAERGAEHLLHLAPLRIEGKQPAAVISDEGAAVAVELQAVRPAVVLHDELPLALRVDAEDAAERNVDAPKVALPVERRPLEKRIDLRPLAVGIRPGGAAALAELLRQRAEPLHLDFLQRRERV